MKRLLIGLLATAMMIGLPVITQATPGAKVLITDNPNHKVIEIDPKTGDVVWEYGNGTPGSGTNQLNYPNEAIPLTNGNILIADTYNGRIIEVTSDTKQIVWQYTAEYTTTFRPVDVKRCIDYTTGIPRDTLLITDFGANKVIEVTYPGGVVVWELQAGGTGDYLLWEAEKRPGMGTPTYLITSRTQTGHGGNCVIEVQRTGTTTWTWNITWRYDGLTDPRDANWTPCGNVLITDPEVEGRRVIEVEPTYPTGGNIVWQYGPSGYIPFEAMPIETGNILMAGIAPPRPWDPTTWDDNKDGKYPPTTTAYNYTDVREVSKVGTGNTTYRWGWMRYGTGTPYGTGSASAFVDVEEKGIINIAKIEYMDMYENEMPKVFAGVVVPIYQPEVTWVGTPTIVATKTVSPEGSQKPGATLTYTIELTNTGVGTATAVVVTDRVPDGTKYVFDSDSPEANLFSHDGGANWDNSETTEPITHLRWNLGDMLPGETRTLQFSVVIQP